jgi:hypothetical protein
VSTISTMVRSKGTTDCSAVGCTTSAAPRTAAMTRMQKPMANASGALRNWAGKSAWPISASRSTVADPGTNVDMASTSV